MFDDFRAEATGILEKAGVKTPLLEEPPDPKMGDLAFPCFELAKEKGKNPKETAKEISLRVKIPKDSIFREVKALGPYLNFFFDRGKLSEKVVKEINGKKEKYGSSKDREKVLIEHTSINPSGPINVGRIRNTFIGDTLVRLYRFMGYKVLTHYFVNNIGKQVAIIAWGKSKGIEPSSELMEKYEKYKDQSDFQTMFVYVPANAEMEKNEEAQKEVEELLQKCEAGERKSIKLLKDVSSKCLEGQKKTMERFGVKIDSFDFESNFLEDGSVAKFIQRMKKLPEHREIDGLHLIDLSKYGFERRTGGTVFQRTDGTSVYIARDVAYHSYKLKLAKKNINVLGEDHKVEAEELKQILNLLGVLKGKELDVVFFSFVNLKEGRMSTRSGETVPVDAVLDEGVEKASELIRKRYPLSLNKIKSTAEKIAVAALRYSEIKVAPSKSILFDWDEALSFEGETGPYLQYSLVRAKKILEKSKKKLEIGKLEEEEEFELAKKLTKFPEVVSKSVFGYKPHLLANYTYELASLFSRFYEKCPVVKSEKEGERLALVQSFVHVMRNCLELMGIDEVELM